jgi:hypothetical protein
LATAEIVAIDFQPPSVAQEMAGNFKDDPEWDEFQGAIAAYRQELDAELAEEYRQMDEAEQRADSPWIKCAGMFKNDPDFAEIAAAIRAEREVEDDTEVDPSVYSLEG